MTTTFRWKQTKTVVLELWMTLWFDFTRFHRIFKLNLASESNARSQKPNNRWTTQWIGIKTTKWIRSLFYQQLFPCSLFGTYMCIGMGGLPQASNNTHVSALLLYHLLNCCCFSFLYSVRFSVVEFSFVWCKRPNRNRIQITFLCAANDDDWMWKHFATNAHSVYAHVVLEPVSPLSFGLRMCIFFLSVENLHICYFSLVSAKLTPFRCE